MKEKKPTIFVQDFGVYDQDMLVAVGATKDDVVKFCKKTKAAEAFIKFVEDNSDIFATMERDKKKGGLFCGDFNGAKMMILREVEDTAEYWLSLVHETHHTVFYFSKEFSLENEPEAQAYLFGYLLNSIQSKIMGYENKKLRK